MRNDCKKLEIISERKVNGAVQTIKYTRENAFIELDNKNK